MKLSWVEKTFEKIRVDDFTSIEVPGFKMTGPVSLLADPDHKDRNMAKAEDNVEICVTPPEWDSYRILTEVKLGGEGDLKFGISERSHKDGPGVAVRGDSDDKNLIRIRMLYGTDQWETPQNSHDYYLRPPTGIWARYDPALETLEKEFENTQVWNERWLRLSIDVALQELRIWVDGRFVGSVKSDERSQGNPCLFLNRGDLLKFFEILPLKAEEPQFLPVDISPFQNNNAISDGGLEDGYSFPPETLCGEGMISVCGIPFQIDWDPKKANNLDLGCTDFRGRAPYIYCDAFSSDPKRALLRIPKGYYDRVHMICVSDTEDGDLPVGAVRMIKSRRGHAVTSEFTAPTWRQEEKEFKMLKIGNIIGDQGAKGPPCALWLVTVPLSPCDFQDFLAYESETFLEIDLTRKIGLDSELFPHPMGPISSIHIFALTFELALAKMMVGSYMIGHIFESPQVPSMNVSVWNQRGTNQKFVLTAEARGPYESRSLHKFELSLKPWEEKAVRVDFPQEVFGKFDVTFRLIPEDSDRSLERTTSFALLRADTRQATTDSPFGMWCFFEGHHGTGLEVGGTLMQKAGVRWTLPNFFTGKDPKENARRLSILKRHKIKPTAGNLCGLGNGCVEQPEDVEKNFQKMKSMPEMDLWTVFWETFLSRRLWSIIPQELLGRPAVELNEEERRHFDNCWENGISHSERARREFPGVKLVFGGGFPQFIATFLKAGYSKKYLDGFALDFDLFTSMPERQPGLLYAPFAGLYMLKTLQEMYGYSEFPRYLTEAIYSSVGPGWLSEREQADYYVRAHLLGIACGVKRFCMTTEIWDPGSDFFYSHYGPVGLCHMPPELNPRESFPAYSTMTSILDRSEFDGIIPTGSTSVFGLRFARRNEEPVHTFWTVKGKRPVSLYFQDNGKVRITDMFGNVQSVHAKSGCIEFEITSSPTYVEGINQIERMELGQTDHPSGPSGEIELTGFTSLTGWEVLERKVQEIERLDESKIMKSGKLDLEIIPEKCGRGPLLQVGFPDRVDLHPMEVLYTSLSRSESPIQIPESARYVGAWIYGNSSWGRIVFEIRDSKGGHWVSSRADTFIDFDGWRYVKVELPRAPQGMDVQPRGYASWVSDREEGSIYPIELVGIVLEGRSHVIYTDQLIPVPERAYCVDRISCYT